MEQGRSPGDTVEGIRRLTGSLRAWEPEKPDAAAEARQHTPYGSLTVAGLILGITANLVVAAWHPSFRSADGSFSLSSFAFGNLGMFFACLAVLGTAVWLCLQDHERAAAHQRFWRYLCTFGVVVLCLGPLAQLLHLFGPKLDHPEPQQFSLSRRADPGFIA